MPLCHTLLPLLETEWRVQTKLSNIPFENFLFRFKKRRADSVDRSYFSPCRLGELSEIFVARQTRRKRQRSAKKMIVAKKIGFVGVGRMGSNMARRLNECGCKVTAIFDLNEQAADSLANELGATRCERLDELAGLADVVFTVVTDDAAMDKIFAVRKICPVHGSLLQNAKGKIFINCATISPKIHVKVETRAEKAGAATIEACMASSISQARQGTLYLMCGGEKKTFQKVKPLLAKLGNSLRYIGPAGSAAEVKALVNMVMNINTSGLAEGLGLGAALGHNLKMLREVFSQTGANSRVLETDGEDMQKRDHDCYFSATHAAKDSGIALALGTQKKLNLPLAAAAKKQYDTCGTGTGRTRQIRHCRTHL